MGIPTDTTQAVDLLALVINIAVGYLMARVHAKLADLKSSIYQDFLTKKDFYAMHEILNKSQTKE